MATENQRDKLKVTKLLVKFQNACMALGKASMTDNKFTPEMIQATNKVIQTRATLMFELDLI